MIKTFRHNGNACCDSCGEKMDNVMGIRCSYLLAEREQAVYIFLCKNCINELAIKLKRSYYIDKFDEDIVND